MKISSPLRLVLTTWPADRSVSELVATLVGERLAACVNVLAPMTSHYRWEGAIEQAQEVPLVIKTTAEQVPGLEARLRGLHPYEVPEFVVLEATASAAYGAWVRASVE